MAEAMETAPLGAQATQDVEPISRLLGAFWGLWIGDALAMPAHYYDKPDAIHRDYGCLNEYRSLVLPHPGSELTHTQYRPFSAKADVVGPQKDFWGQAGVHPHQNLKPGQNTLNLQLAKVLFESLADCGGYDAEDYLQRYINFMFAPEVHGDTWVDLTHRTFFEHYAQGRPPMGCGSNSHSMSGIVLVLPIMIFYWNDPKLAVTHAENLAQLTHKGDVMARAIHFVSEIMGWVFKGKDLDTALYRKMGKTAHSCLQYPLRRWAVKDDFALVGHELFNGPILEEGLPMALYLALKYENDPGQALLVNTHLGGDNCHRGAFLGALLGAVNGVEKLPSEWVFGLSSHRRLDVISDALLKRA